MVHAHERLDGVASRQKSSRRTPYQLNIRNANGVYGGWAADMVVGTVFGRPLAARTLASGVLAPIVTCRRELVIAHRKTCSDFRLASVEIHNRTGHPPKW